jgi:octaprenyl-diphosphate synthase
LSAEYDDNTVSRAIARASREVCAGEILQTQRRYDLNLSVPDYLKIIEMKTAALFAAATHLGAYLNGSSPAVLEAMKNYGLRLGTAYQIYDDCLDLVGDESTAGKTLRTDLAKGKLTLPVLYLLESATDLQKTKLNRMLLNGEPMETTILASIADYEGAVERAIKFAKAMLGDARNDLICLGDSAHRTALVEITGYLDKLLDKCRAVV